MSRLLEDWRELWSSTAGIVSRAWMPNCAVSPMNPQSSLQCRAPLLLRRPMESDTRTNAASSAWSYRQFEANFWNSISSRFEALMNSTPSSIEAIGSIRGVGELLVYDTALRIGAKLELMPDRVYLHSGTRRGARSLGLPFKMRLISIAELPVPLRSLKQHEVEDCLCIFKDLLQASIP